MATVLFGSLAYTGWRIYLYLKEAMTTEARALINDQVVSPEQIAKLAKTILHYSIDNPMDYATGAGFLFVILSFVGTVAFGAMVSAYAASVKPSFVILTAKAEERRKIVLDKDQNNWFKFVATISGGLALSVVGNYLFYLILTYFLR
jgi:hypothetical protein